MTNNIATQLTAEQKAAILTALKWVGLWASMDTTDTESLLPKFADKLNANFSFLNFDHNNKLLSIYENEESEDLLFKTLNSIPAMVKPWFVVETYMMLSAQGNITQRAMQVTLLYCDKMGIPEEKYLSIIQQAYIATGDY